MIEISSAQNIHFKRWLELESSRGIKKHGEFFLMGEKLIHEFLKNPNKVVKAEIICEGHSPLTTKLKLSQKEKITTYKLSKALFSQIDFVGTHFNLLVLESTELPAFNPQEKLTTNNIQVLAPLGDPSNLGALIRSAAAFKAHSLVLTQESAHPFHPKSIKSSAGAVLSFNIFKSPLKVGELLGNLDHVAALDMNGTPLQKYVVQNYVRLLVGEEGPGLPEKIKAERIMIPTANVESLNATVAASIALWHLGNKLV